jgi:hypothetical protein
MSEIFVLKNYLIVEFKRLLPSLVYCLAGIVAIVIGSQETSYSIDIQWNSKYFILTSYQLSLIVCIIFVLQGIGYLIVKFLKGKLIGAIIWLHLFGTFVWIFDEVIPISIFMKKNVYYSFSNFMITDFSFLVGI